MPDTDMSIDSELRDALRRADAAHQHGAEGAQVELPSLGVAVGVTRVADDYEVTIWSTKGRHAAEEAQVRRVLAAMFTEAAPQAREQASGDYDRVFRIPISAVPPHPEVLIEPAATAGIAPAGENHVDIASEESFPASDAPAW